jgi:hypothetical protein
MIENNRWIRSFVLRLGCDNFQPSICLAGGYEKFLKLHEIFHHLGSRLSFRRRRPAMVIDLLLNG